MIEVESESESGGAVQVGSQGLTARSSPSRSIRATSVLAQNATGPIGLAAIVSNGCTFTATARTHRSAQRRAAGKGLNRRRVNSGTLFDPTRQLQRQLEAKMNSRNGQVEITLAADQFLGRK